MSDLHKLLERVKAATGADRELDALLCIKFAPPTIMEHWLSVTPRKLDPALWTIARNGYVQHPDWCYGDGTQGKSQSQPFTASIDAALALVERILPGWRLDSLQDMRGERYTVCILRNDARGHAIPRESGAGSTRPLAILAALLTALIAQEPRDE